MNAGVGWVERKPLDLKVKERSGSLWIRKGRRRVEQKRSDQLFISGRLDAKYFPLSYYRFAAIGILARRELGKKNS